MNSEYALARIRQHADKWLFFVAFLLGAFIIMFIDTLNWPKAFAVGICIIALLGYAVMTGLMPMFRLRPDQAADNVYYLGLLYTLTSLGMALLRFSTEGGTDAILRNFGIAIATTIVGLGLRVFLSQFRDDPDDLEYEAKAALAESVRSLRGELDRSLAEMQNFTVGAKQALQEMSEAAGKSSLEALSITIGRFEAAADEMGKQFGGAAVSFHQRTEAFEKSLDKVATVVDQLSDRIGAVKVDSSTLEDGMRPAFDALAKYVAQFAGAFGDNQARLERSLTTLAKLADTLEAFDRSAEGLSRSTQNLEQAATAIGEGAASFTRLDAASRTAADAATSFGRSIDQITEQQGRQSREITDVLAQATLQLTERTKGALGSVDDTARQVAATIASLNSELRGSSEAVQHVRRELAELAGWIITRLDTK